MPEAEEYDLGNLLMKIHGKGKKKKFIFFHYNHLGKFPGMDHWLDSSGLEAVIVCAQQINKNKNVKS